MRRIVGLVAVGWALACGSGPPDGAATAVRVTPTPCGGWHAEIDYIGEGVEVTVDGQPRGPLPTTDTPTTTTLDGLGTPGRSVTVVATGPAGAAEGGLNIVAFRPPLEVAIEKWPDPIKVALPGDPVTLRVAGPIGTACSTDGWTWTATMPDGSTTAPSDLELVPTPVPIPDPGGLGPRVIHVALQRPDGAKWAEDVRYEVVASTDADRDGFAMLDAGGGDCDDHDAAKNPGRTEHPDGVDEDCDGTVDEETVAYDDDGDGLSERQGDCDDTDRGRAPGLAEIGDCRDQDCDGQIDEGVTRALADDSLEPNDDAAHAHALGKDVIADLTVVSRDKSDAEWFSVVTTDVDGPEDPLRVIGSLFQGSLDGWRLKVVAEHIPDDARYRVVFYQGETQRGSGTLARDGERVRMNGTLAVDDSGEWRVQIVPEKLPGDACPATFRIRGD